MDITEKKIKEKEVAEMIKDLTNSAQELYNKAPVSLKERQDMTKCINKIKLVSIEDEQAMEEATSEAYGQMFLLSTKIMYKNIVELNKVAGKDTDLTDEVSNSVKEMEFSLYNVIKGMEERDEELFSNNIHKIQNIATFLAEIKAKSEI